MVADHHGDLSDRAYAARLAERLAGPAHAIEELQQFILESALRDGLRDIVPDLQRVLTAAASLTALIDRILKGEAWEEQAPGIDRESRLRHDLRTPLNAMIGYSEMIAEDFADELPKPLLDDIAMVARQSKSLQGQIDRLVEFARTEDDPDAADEADYSIAAQLARTVATPLARRDGELGRILIVDDTEFNRDLLARRLEGEGHTVETASSAAEALAKMAESEFDLALVDILMPEVNGIELLSMIKGAEATRDLPVLMISGLNEEHAVARCIEAGADDYLPKPVNPVLLRARISSCLERRRLRQREQRHIEGIRQEKERAKALLHSILPTQVVTRLDLGERVIADRFEAATIVFADIVGFTALATRIPPAKLIQRLGALFSRFDDLAERYGVEKIKTIGDAYMAASGIPEPREDHARAAVEFARALVAETMRDDRGDTLSIRVGINTGPIIAGLIGRKRFVYDVWGHTVNVASRLESSGIPDRIQVSPETLEALGGAEGFELRGQVELRGVGEMTTYLVR